MNILEELADHARERTAAAKNKCTLAEMKTRALSMPKGNFPFEEQLKKDGLSFICECKKASPSKGLIAAKFPYLEIAKEYEAAGADAISVLTEPKWFLGDARYLEEIAAAVNLPVLRKDFIVDEYMIYEAKVLGAAAILLIVSILSAKELKEYLSVAKGLGLSVLTEAHDAGEIETAAKAGAKIIGVNNRNLKDFSVDINNSLSLRNVAPKDTLFVVESGISTAEDIKAARDIKADAVLVGEALMRATDKKAKLRELKGL